MQITTPGIGPFAATSLNGQIWPRYSRHMAEIPMQITTSGIGPSTPTPLHGVTRRDVAETQPKYSRDTRHSTVSPAEM